MNSPNHLHRRALASTPTVGYDDLARFFDALEAAPVIDFQPADDPARSSPDAELLPPPPGDTVDVVERLREKIGRSIQAAAAPTTIPGFDVIREIGRGSMGIVFEAMQFDLRRIVAIKVLFAPVLDPELVLRFRAEGEAAARLRHPNVVEIHLRGDVHGHPYLVMERIDGGSLAERLAAAAFSSTDSARLVHQLTKAIGRAHELGVIHRDLKPANVLLTSDGIPKITDFGLAKLLDASDAGSYPGTVLGTPAYMAPEQASPDRTDVGPAADIYALGALLYECLTGRPPFRAASALTTLELVRIAEPVSPRRCNPEVPRDLETICLTCLRKAPQHRYATAAALGNDLERFLDGRPIRARPTGSLERVWKWCRRRPAWAAFIALSAMAAAAGAAGLIVHAERMRREVERANHGEALAAAARDEADANYRAARDALQRILIRVDPRRTDMPAVKDLRRGQLEDALSFYRVLTAREGTSPVIRFDAARTGLEAARLEQRLGHDSEAETNLRRAARHFSTLADEFPAQTAYRAGHAEAVAELGTLSLGLGRLDEALRFHEQALELRSDLSLQNPDSREFSSALAQSHHGMGNVFWSRKQTDEAMRHYRQSVEIRERLIRERPSADEERRLAETEINMSVSLQVHPTRVAESSAWHDRAERRLENLLAARPDDTDCLCSLAMSRVNWAYVQRDRGQKDDALAGIARNIRPLETAMAREPTDGLVRDRLHCTYGVQAQLLGDSRRWPESAAAWEKVVQTSLPERRNFNRLFWADALESAGESARAMEVVETAAASFPESPPWEQLYHLAGLCARIRGRDSDSRVGQRANEFAVRFLSRVKDSMPDGQWQQLRRGLLADRQFDPLKSDSVFRRLMQNETQR